VGADVFNVGLFIAPLLFAAECAFLAFFVQADLLILCSQQGELVAGIEVGVLSSFEFAGADDEVVIGFNG